MSRRIYCQKCGEKWKPYAEDVRMGWQHRMVYLVVKQPVIHNITIITESSTTVKPVKGIFCDLCGDEIPDGSIAFAITMWQENPIDDWEQEYGTVIPEAAAKAAQMLAKRDI